MPGERPENEEKLREKPTAVNSFFFSFVCVSDFRIWMYTFVFKIPPKQPKLLQSYRHFSQVHCENVPGVTMMQVCRMGDTCILKVNFYYSSEMGPS